MKNGFADKSPYLIPFEQIGDEVSGFLTTTQQASKLPFRVNRIFWIYKTPPGEKRGGHANLKTEEVMVAVQGKAIVRTETVSGKQEKFELDTPDTGLYIPEYCWLDITLEPGAILVCMASTDYDGTDYIRDLNEFRNLKTL